MERSHRQDHAAQGTGRRERKAILARWTFGRSLLAERGANGGNKLPDGRLTALASTLGISRTEIQHRIRFAKQYRTKAKVARALRIFGSWHRIVQLGLYESQFHKEG
jgi:hypothetical protein